MSVSKELPAALQHPVVVPLQTTADAASAPTAAPGAAFAGLVWTLVRTDFKARYHGTLSGFVWALLKPLTMFAVLTGVFDPPPAAVTVPWTYLVATAGTCVVALGVAAETAARRRRGSAVELVREV